ncbi:class I SAM-dependent methyltransferase [Actinacidiphila oryziradicis]|uniref:Class I SAM-dependent methyltransferase n=1 Tax=Actinacidiphila oryziradicis TaxID=2571141 RepID=A0A4U0SRI1_9ACTN|nr:class I SAM-dependent methyltransferase [Actinacidiphila oryziradicis]TKA12730.1 class I SAM-dependent methyltransferase [Actinacidiphila oryziradicis]
MIGEDAWTEALALDRPLDAAVSTTALHYLPQDTLRRTYAQLATLLRPGGVLVNGDHLLQDGAKPSRIAAHIGHRRAERQQALTHDDWESWWTAVADDPELADLLAERRHRQPTPGPGNGNGLTLSHHTELLRQAGFEHAVPVWQFGNSYVLVALR